MHVIASQWKVTYRGEWMVTPYSKTLFIHKKNVSNISRGRNFIFFSFYIKVVTSFVSDSIKNIFMGLFFLCLWCLTHFKKRITLSLCQTYLAIFLRIERCCIHNSINGSCWNTCDMPMVTKTKVVAVTWVLVIEREEKY